MSISYHVFAARNTTPEQAAEVIPALQGLPCHVEHGWVWYQVPPWDFTADALADAMAGLPGPVLLATLHDYDCWTLRLHGEGQLPFAVCFEFSRLLLDDEPDDPLQEVRDHLSTPEEPIAGSLQFEDAYFSTRSAKATGKVEDAIAALLQRPAELGLPVPEDIAEELRSENPDEIVDAFLEWICDEILDALDEYGIPHDPDEVDAVLLGDAVSDMELEAPDGNLPRLLLALGLTEDVADWVARLSEGDEGPLDELGEAKALRADLEHILANSSKGKLVPLEGGPLSLELDDLDLLVRVGWLCSHMVGCAIGFELPPGHTLDDFPLAFDWTPKGAGARTALYPGDFLELEEDRSEILKVLKGLPDGTQITLWFGDENYKVARQCYAGPRMNGLWHITECSPSVEGGVLREALGFARILQRNEPLLVHSREEYDAACALSARTSGGIQALPELEGLTIVGDDDARFEIAVSMFRLRFQDTWDTSKVQGDEQQETVGYLGDLHDMLERMAIPFREPALFEGAGRMYYSPDIEAMDFDGKRDTALLALERSRERVLSQGYRLVGDLFCVAHPFEFMRLYRSPDGIALLIEAVGQLGVGYRHLYSNLGGTGALLTTTAPNRASAPHRGLLVRQADEAALEALDGEHREGLELLARKGISPAVLPNTVEALCPLIEDLYFRMEGVSPEAPATDGVRLPRI